MPPYAASALRVYLLDDHDLVRRGLRDLLAPARDLEVVGESGSARGALAEVPGLDVDVLLLDLQLQDGTGIEVCRAVRAADPSVRGLLLTSSGDDEALAATLLAGAAGYLVKLANGIDVIGAVRRVGAGRPVLEPDVAARAADALRRRAADLEPPLTARERDVLDQVLQGLTDQEVADRAGLTLDDAAAEVAAVTVRLTAR